MKFRQAVRHVSTLGATILAVACAVTPSEKLGSSAAAADSQGVYSKCNSSVHFADQGGHSRPGPATIVPILWGFPDDETDRIGQLDVAYSKIEGSNYYKWLEHEYSAPALSHLTPVSVEPLLRWTGLGANGVVTPFVVNGDDLLNAVAGAVRSNVVPTNVSNPIYAIHLGPGVTVTKSDGTKLCSSFLAYNGYDMTFDIQGGWETYYYLVIPDFATCGLGFDGITRVLSHEIAENVTDPNYDRPAPWPVSGWQDNTQPAGCEQVGDLCANFATRINTSIGGFGTGTNNLDYTLVVQKLWSNEKGACVTEDDFTAPTVTSISPTVAGAGAVVTINGTNFEGFPTVLFGSTPSPNVTCPSSTQCYATVPAGTDSVDVTVQLNDFSLDAGRFFYFSCKYQAACYSLDVQCTVDSASDPITISASPTDNSQPPQTGPSAQFMVDSATTFGACETTPYGQECIQPVSISAGQVGSGCPPPACQPTGAACDGRCGIAVSNGCGGSWYCGACGPPPHVVTCPPGTYKCGTHCC